MSEWFKFFPSDWNVGTDDLSLEQEAAYLRIINAIQLHDQPIKNNLRVLGGLWRCNERKAKRLLKELLDLGKVSLEGDCITNRRAVEDVSNRRQLRVERQSAGSRGGIQSAKSRAKSLKTNKQAQASGSTRIEENRIDKNRKEKVNQKEKVLAIAKPPPKKKAIRIPEGFPSQVQVDWALDEKIPPQIIEAETDKFRDYWCAIPGTKGTKLDWPATWRNWIRRNMNGNYNGSGHSNNGNGYHPQGALQNFALGAAAFAGITGGEPGYDGPTNGYSGGAPEGTGPIIDISPTDGNGNGDRESFNFDEIENALPKPSHDPETGSGPH